MTTATLKQTLPLLLTTLLPTYTHAQPAAAVLEEIRAAYDPHVTSKNVGESFPLFGCPIRELEITGADPIHRQARAVKVSDYFWGAEKDRAGARTILLLPPTGGVNALDTGYADYLCRQGFRVLLISRWANDTDTVNMELASHDQSALRALVAVKHVVEFVAPVREQQIGILGTSVGGLTASLALGEDKRIAAAALIVAGGKMPEIIAHTTEAGAARLRKARFQQFGFTDETAYEKALRGVLRYDNYEFSNFTGHKPVWLSMGMADLTVPTKNQIDLMEALAPRSEDVVQYQSNHVQAILWTYLFQKGAISGFFARELR